MKRRRVKVPVRKRNVVVCVLSLITIFTLIFFVAGPIDLSGVSYVRWIAGALFIVMVINLILLIIGIRDSSDNQYSALFRVLAIILPAAALGTYVIIYLIGIFT